MKYRICKMFEIENGHMLSKHPDKCKFPHGHTRKVELVVECDTLDANEMVFDFKVFKEAIGKFVDGFDHAMCMNTDDPMYNVMRKTYGDRIIAFDKKDPTTEVMAEIIFRVLRKQLASAGDFVYPVRSEVRVVKVRVWETSSTWAEVSEGGEN